MKQIIEYFLIFLFFILSLLFTEQTTLTIKKEDPIMKKIVSNVDKYKIESVNALIDGNTIIPGIKGCTIDINQSYENMKKINEYTENMLKYRDIIPEITLNNIYNKYIISGNTNKRKVSIVINLNDNLEETLKIIELNKEKTNIFVDSTLLEDNIFKINKEYIHIYNGGLNNNYDDITIEWMNDVIGDNYNKSLYCINKNQNDDNLLLCARNRMHTINPKITTNVNLYKAKQLIQNGSIIYFDKNTIDKLNNIILYIKSKGYEIVFLDELLTEETC